jgi:hypothetical protein
VVDEVKMLNAEALKKRYGIRGDMTIWRWLRDPELPLPAPRVIHNRRYWLVAELEEFDRKVAAVGRSVGRPIGTPAEEVA